MPELIEAYWPYLLIALLIGVAIAWFAFVANRRTSVATDTKDVLDEGAAPAQRNQALIDTPAAAAPKVEVPEPAPAPTQQGDAQPAVRERTAAAPAAVPSPPPAPSTGGDDLTRIKGLGPKLATMLESEGVTQFAQIAAWDEAEIDRIDALLGRFQGRIRRDNWVEQARLLARGDDTAFTDKFGRN